MLACQSTQSGCSQCTATTGRSPAAAAGVPVITTPNAGSVVRHGIDGFIVPIRDAEAIVAAIDTIRLNPSLLYNLSRNAALRAREFTVNPPRADRDLAGILR